MQTANIMLALGGDTANTVPKYGVTTAEIAILMAIHSEQAIFDVEPTGSNKVTNRDELVRLMSIYGVARDHENNQVVKMMYPGAGAYLPQELRELNLAPEQFKALNRVSVEDVQVEDADVDEETPDEAVEEAVVEAPAPKSKKTTSKKKPVEEAPVAPEADEAASDDVDAPQENALD